MVWLPASTGIGLFQRIAATGSPFRRTTTPATSGGPAIVSFDTFGSRAAARLRATASRASCPVPPASEATDRNRAQADAVRFTCS